VKPKVGRQRHAEAKSQTGGTIALPVAKDEGINVDVNNKRVTVQFKSITP
jgi:hypothetical protein